MSKQRKCYGICFFFAMVFVNRKQFYSINVQAVCESDAFITNIVARWPGSTHDSRIFDNSNIADKLRDGAINGILVGDGRYACRAYKCRASWVVGRGRGCGSWVVGRGCGCG